MGKEERFLEIVKHYVKESKGLTHTAKQFRVTTQTVRNAIKSIKMVDYELYKAAKEKLGDKANKRYRSKPILRESFNTLPRLLTKKQLIDWYVNSEFAQNISVVELISIAKSSGISIKGY